MSCETNQNRVSAVAAPASGGISARQNKFAGLAGRLGRQATGSLRVIESFDGPGSLDALLGGGVVLETGFLLASLRARQPAAEGEAEDIELSFKDPDAVPGWAEEFIKQRVRTRLGSPADDRRYREGSKPDWEPAQNRFVEELGRRPPRRKEEGFSAKSRTADILARRALIAVPLLKLGQTVSQFAATGVARLSRPEKSDLIGGVEQRFFFPNTSKIPVTVWQSSLTPLFNLADGFGSRIVGSEGKMFEARGKTWHCGTLVVQTARGTRTVTHLQGLSIPAAHYYYSRPLGENDVVGIITGQKGFDPKTVSPGGYAGQISEVEALCPLWASLKRGLIQAHLRWGEASSVSEAPQPQAEETAADGTENKDSKRRKRRGKLPSGGREEVPAPSGDLPTGPPRGGGPKVELGGRAYPVFVRRVVETADQRRLAEAAYYDDRAGAWQEVKDPAVRERLAVEVEAGLLKTWDD